MDLDVVMRSNECLYIVKFYGALFKEVGMTQCKIWYDHFIWVAVLLILIVILQIKIWFVTDFCLQGDCWICMELMSISLDKFYKFVHGHLHQSIPEDILGKITVAVGFPLALSDTLTLILY